MKFDQDLLEKWRKFKKDRRAFLSLMTLVVLFTASLPSELVCNIRPILMKVDERWYFPMLFTYSEKDFPGGASPNEPDYLSETFQAMIEGRTAAPAPSSSPAAPTGGFSLSTGDFDEAPVEKSGPAPFTLTLEDFEEKSPAASAPTSNTPLPANSHRQVWILWPPVRYDYKYIPTTSKSGKEVLAAPWETREAETVVLSSTVDGHYLGTDDRGRDVLARLIYGFRISMLFGVSLAITGTLLGCLLGGVQGYFGGWIDLLGQRFTEIWGSMPRLYILITLSSFLVPSALFLFVILNLTAWMGIATYIRAEFLKSRNLEYVKAARAMGVADFQIMLRHILPNSLTPVITFFPFEVTAGVLALVSLDFLNLGVPSPAPSIGELLAQGKQNLQATWIILPTFLLLTTTLTLLTFIGDGIRNAFDPRKSA